MIPAASGPQGPAHHHELFGRLNGAGIDFLLTGAAALTLHGVPRLSAELELLLPAGEQEAALERLLVSWGYREETAGHGGPRRFAHAVSALADLRVYAVDAARFEALQGRAARFHLIDQQIPVVGRADLLAERERSAHPQDREDAASLRLLEAVLRGDAGADGSDPRAEQLRKFSRWHTENRLEWLLAAARLARGLTPEQGAPAGTAARVKGIERTRPGLRSRRPR